MVNDGTLNNSTTQTTTLSITAVGRRAGAQQRGGERVLQRECRAGDAVAGCGGERRRQPDPAVGDGVDQQRPSHGDVLAATTAGTSITASYNAASGVLTLTGNDTLAHYQQVLDSVTYVSTSDNPTNFGTDTSRTISWVVNDGTLNNSTIQTTTLSIVAADDAPVLSTWRRLPPTARMPRR